MMKPLRHVFVFAMLTLTVAVNQKDSDEGNPYEFGFTIDGQQHRHEKKDQNGIVQGEFGFITADGVYHVTVYATDENGNFKILSMRNIRISAPLDGSPATGPISPEASKYLGKANLGGETGAPAPVVQQSQQQPSVQPQPQPQPQTQQQLQPQPPPPPPPPPQQAQPDLQPQPQITTVKPLPLITQKSGPYVFTTQSTIKPACGGCGYVTTQKSAPGEPFPFQNPLFQKSGQSPTDAKNVQENGQTDISAQVPSIAQSQTPQPEVLPPNLPVGGQENNVLPPTGPQENQQQNFQFNQQTQQEYKLTQTYNEENKFSQTVQNGNEGGNEGSTSPLQQPGADLLPPGINIRNQGINQQNSQTSQGQEGYKSQNQQTGGNNAPSPGPNPLIDSNDQVSKLPPVSVADNVIHVGGENPKDIQINDKFPGMTDGLPDGIEEKDIKDLLYKFHYTVGFHGHYEKGLKNGAKVGGYFVNGRDGISRVVTYVADENGYRPKFKFINLGLDSPDTPKEDSEKKFGLKSFEFVWYPIE